MKALVIDEYSLDNVHIEEVPEPELGPGEVGVALEAAALNHLDLWTVSGALAIEHRFPHVIGADGAGTIDSLGPGVGGPKPGTKVIINPALSCGGCEFCRAGEQSMCVKFRMIGEHVPGTFAQKVVVPQANVFPAPAHLSAAEAAALGVTFVTAYRMLFTRGRMRPGDWVLITGIGGGLALSALQLAKPVAGRILVTSSSQKKIDRAVEIGAEAGVLYTDEDAARKLRSLTSKRGVDIVVDSAGGPAVDLALKSLRKGGRVLIAGATAGARAEFDVRRLFWNQLEIVGSTMGSNSDFADMVRMVAGTGLKPLVDRVASLDEGADALRHLQSGDHFGKIVIDIPQ